MTKLRQFEVMLLQPEAVYVPGQTISGHVVVTASKPLKTRGIQIRLRGFGFIRGRERQTDVMRTQKEEYVTHAYTLLGDPKSRMHSEQHPEGIRMYPFEFTLPYDVPPSVELGDGDKTGYVRYSLEAELVKPLKANVLHRVYFTVTSTVDLNTMPAVTLPCEGDASLQTRGCCCSGGSVTINFSVNRQGHVAGECVHVVGKVTNGTRRKIRCSTTSLLMLVTLRFGRSRTMQLSREVASFEKGSTGRRKTQEIDANILIPPVPPSGVPHCNLMDIRYELHVTARTKREDLTAKMDITIGTVPLRNVRAAYATLPYPTLEQGVTRPPPPAVPMITPSHDTPSSPTTANTPTRLAPPVPPTPTAAVRPVPMRVTPSAPTLSTIEATPGDVHINTMESDEAPPPSYQECALGRVSMYQEDTEGATNTGSDVMWAPRYSYFTWGRNHPPPNYHDLQ